MCDRECPRLDAVEHLPDEIRLALVLSAVIVIVFNILGTAQGADGRGFVAADYVGFALAGLGGIVLGIVRPVDCLLKSQR